MTTQTQYEIKQREETEATVRITVDAQEIRNQLDSVYQQYAREVRIPGFRKGRVPRAYLDSRFGKDLFMEETKDELQRKHFEKALLEVGLRPVSVPSLDEVSFDEADGFVFDATFSVLPDIDAPAYEGQEVSVPVLRDVTDDEVDATLEEIRTEFATLGEKEGDAVSAGDIVRVKENEQEWDACADEDNPVTKKLIGAAVGSTVEIDAEVSEERRIKTRLEVVGLREIVLPDIDDELAKDAGFESLEQLKTDIREKMTTRRSEQHQRFVEGRLLDALVEKAEIPLPDPFIKDLVDEEIERIKKSLEEPRSTMTFEAFLEQRETTEETLREELHDSISHRVRRELILQKLAEAENIAFDDDELTELAKQDAEAAGEDPMRFVARLKAEDRWGDYRGSKVNEQVFAKLRQAAVIKEEEE